MPVLGVCHRGFNGRVGLERAGRFGAAWQWRFTIVGLSYVAKRESFRGPIPYWPLLLLAAPIILAMLMNMGDARATAIWGVAHFRAVGGAVRADDLFQSGEVNVKRIVSGLLAGIVFVDWLAVAPLISPAKSASCSDFIRTSRCSRNASFRQLEINTALLAQRFIRQLEINYRPAARQIRHHHHRHVVRRRP